MAGETQMHHRCRVTKEQIPGPRTEGTRPMASFPRYPQEQMAPKNRKDPSDFHRQLLEERLRDPEFRAEYDRLRAEMFDQLAPASEGPVVKLGRKRKGRLIFGDASE